MDLALVLGIPLGTPLLVLLVVRARGPLQPIVAFRTAILAELASLGVLYCLVLALVKWQRTHPMHGSTVYLFDFGPGWLWRRLVGIGVLLAVACITASVFLLGQWMVRRLTSSWSQRGV
jgi:hypothetical protein